MFTLVLMASMLQASDDLFLARLPGNEAVEEARAKQFQKQLPGRAYEATPWDILYLARSTIHPQIRKEHTAILRREIKGQLKMPSP